jgi:hypothetical protein
MGGVQAATQLFAEKAPPDVQVVIKQKVKEIWSEALSGFANTQGGVLIWGIKAVKDTTTGIDAARDLSLVRSPSSFATQLCELHGEATDPPVLGVEVQPFDDPQSPAKASLSAISRSRIRPHRAEFQGKRFYIRALDDFRVASISLLRSMFYPMSRALLTPSFQVFQKDGRTIIDLVISNRGSATAGDIVLRVRHDRELTPSVSSGSWKVGPRLVPPYRNPNRRAGPSWRCKSSYSIPVSIRSNTFKALWFSVDVFLPGH